MKLFCIALAILAQAALFAANVPVEWTADVESLHIQNLSARRGETLDLAVSLTYHGKPFAPEGDWEIFYQTNGMEDVYFTFPVVIDGNVARLTFTPSMDPGAERITGFIGRRGVNYRAAFALKFYGSPGATPNALTLPTKTIDFAQIEVHNAPWITASDLGDKRGKTDLTVYRKTVLSSNWSFVCHLADECQPVLVNGVEPNFYDVIFTPPRDEGDVEFCSMGIWGNVELGSGPPDGEIIFDPRNGLPTSARLPYAATFGGKPYKVGEWPRLKTFSTPTDDKLATTGDIAALTPEKLGAFPAADGRQLAAQVSAQGAHLNAEDARFVSTNYDSKVRLPEAYFEIKLPSGEWARMWSEMTRWNWFLEGIYSPWTNAVAAALSTKGEKEWGFFDAATGAPAPDGFLWVSMPRIAICAGAAYQRIAEAQGSYWVLESNGMVAELNGTTNGYFRIVDDEGKAQFEIVKGDKMTVYAAPSTFTSSIMGVTHYHVTYKVQNAAEAPKAEFKRNLPDEGWLREGEAGCPCNVSWTKRDDSTYECEWWPIGNEPRLFMQAAFAVGGETRIRQTAPVEMEKIIIGSKTYIIGVSDINGKKVLTLE